MRRSTRRMVAGGAALALIGGSLAAALTFSASGPPPVIVMNTPLPAFSLPNVVPDGPPVSSAALRSRPAVVLNMWGSWCPPCVAEMPALEAAHRLLGPKVTFVGLDVGDQRSSAIAFIRRSKVTYPSGFDPGYAVADRIGNDGTPMTYFIAHGKVLIFNLGPLTEQSLLSFVQLYFGIS